MPAQITVAVPIDRCRPDLLHCLRNHADVRLRASVVAESVDVQPVVEVREQNDIMLEHEVGAPSAAAPPPPPPPPPPPIPPPPAPNPPLGLPPMPTVPRERNPPPRENPPRLPALRT